MHAWWHLSKVRIPCTIGDILHTRDVKLGQAPHVYSMHVGGTLQGRNACMKACGIMNKRYFLVHFNFLAGKVCKRSARKSCHIFDNLDHY